MLHYVNAVMRRTAQLGAAKDMDTTLGETCAYSLLICTLLVIGVVAVAWPLYRVRIDQKKLAEGYVTARNSQPWWAITASFFSSSMGAWVLSAPADIGASVGAWGVIGYAIATGLPWSFLAIFGPRMRKLTEGRGFTSTDYIRLRLGFSLHIIYALVTFGTLFLSCVVEAVTIGQIFITVSPRVHPAIVTTAVAVTVFIYTGLAGIRATLLTDRVQSVVLAILIVVAMSCIFGEVAPKISSAALREAGSFRMEGFVSLLVLNVSCWFPTFMDPSAWSRCYAADSERAAKKGLLIGSLLLLIPMTFFGTAGILTAAGQRDGVIPETESTFFALFKVVSPAWSVILLLLATCLSTSTIDTYATAFTSCVASEFAQTHRDINYNWCRLIAFLVFILAVVTALENPPSVMTLFMIGNLLATIATPGLLLSLWDFVSPIGIFSGMIAGALTVFSIGWYRVGTFRGGFQWWLLPEGSTTSSALVTFVLTGSITAITMIGVSQLNFLVDADCRERQRQAFENLKNFRNTAAVLPVATSTCSLEHEAPRAQEGSTSD